MTEPNRRVCGECGCGIWSEVGVQADGEPFCKDGEDADPGDGRGVGAQMF